MSEFTPAELTGRTDGHVAAVPGTGARLHSEVVAPFLALRAAAAADGLALEVVSGFRDFDRQRRIWNEKCRGERPVLDRAGRRVDPASLSPDARIDVVLAWSALPGASRHHWGTDLDVVDAAATPGYRPQLVPDEFAPGGPFARLDRWLAANAVTYGFHRPYDVDRGGVQPEPWHLSHRATADRAYRALDVALLRDALVGAGLELEADVLARLPELHARYVWCSGPPARATDRGEGACGS